MFTILTIMSIEHCEDDESLRDSDDPVGIKSVTNTDEVYLEFVASDPQQDNSFFDAVKFTPTVINDLVTGKKIPGVGRTIEPKNSTNDKLYLVGLSYKLDDFGDETEIKFPGNLKYLRIRLKKRP